jgi:caffeoyl-CoA O-methyltransferase
MLDERVQSVLARLEQEDAAERDAGLPAMRRSRQVSPATGRFLFTLAASQAGVEVLEIGGSRGYSSIWLAAGARILGGRLVSLEQDPSKCEAWWRNVRDAGLEEWAELVDGDAHATLASTEDTFDLVFLDAEKDEYEALFALVRPLLEPGGIVLADNVLSHVETLGAYSAARQADTPSRASRCRSTVVSSCPWFSVRLPDLAHEAVQVAVGVAEERHPQLVIGHASDEVRLVVERNPSFDQLRASCLDVVDAEVQRRARVVELVGLGLREHQTHVAAREECQRPGVEQEVESERVAVEHDGAVDVVDSDRDLPDARYWGGHPSSSRPSF